MTKELLQILDILNQLNKPTTNSILHKDVLEDLTREINNINDYGSKIQFYIENLKKNDASNIDSIMNNLIHLNGSLIDYSSIILDIETILKKFIGNYRDSIIKEKK